VFLKNTYSYFGANLDHDPAQGIFKRNFYNNCGIEHILTILRWRRFAVSSCL